MTSPSELTSGSDPTVSDCLQLKEAGDDFVNLPNLISMAQMVSGPVLRWMIVNEWYSAAMVGLAVSGASDWWDGYVARRMRINSVVDSYLDPLADKVLIGCVALAMVHKDLLHRCRYLLIIPSFSTSDTHERKCLTCIYYYKLL
ncbi:hypothetical protein ACLB2K_045236 [Fragaria x ananassa]